MTSAPSTASRASTGRLTRPPRARQAAPTAGDGGVAPQLLDGPVGEDARGHDVPPAREVPGDVRHRLPLAEADLLGGQVHARSAQLHHADLEGDARPERWLLEDERHGADRAGRASLARPLAGLELGGEA